MQLSKIPDSDSFTTLSSQMCVYIYIYVCVCIYIVKEYIMKYLFIVFINQNNFDMYFSQATDR